MDSVFYRDGDIRWQVAVVKSLASALSIAQAPRSGARDGSSRSARRWVRRSSQAIHLARWQKRVTFCRPASGQGSRRPSTRRSVGFHPLCRAAPKAGLIHSWCTRPAARPMTPWQVLPVCCSKGDENISVMVTHAKPKRRQRPTGRTGLDGNGGQPAADFLSGMRYAVHIASQRLLANASGSIRSGSTGHH